MTPTRPLTLAASALALCCACGVASEAQACSRIETPLASPAAFLWPAPDADHAPASGRIWLSGSAQALEVIEVESGTRVAYRPEPTTPSATATAWAPVTPLNPNTAYQATLIPHDSIEGHNPTPSTTVAFTTRTHALSGLDDTPLKLPQTIRYYRRTYEPVEQSPAACIDDPTHNTLREVRITFAPDALDTSYFIEATYEGGNLPIAYNDAQHVTPERREVQFTLQTYEEDPHDDPCVTLTLSSPRSSDSETITICEPDGCLYQKRPTFAEEDEFTLAQCGLNQATDELLVGCATPAHPHRPRNALWAALIALVVASWRRFLNPSHDEAPR